MKVRKKKKTYKSAPYFKSTLARPTFPVMKAKCKAEEPKISRNMLTLISDSKFKNFDAGEDEIIFAAICTCCVRCFVDT
jgi:hypothetical protein